MRSVGVVSHARVLLALMWVCSTDCVGSTDANAVRVFTTSADSSERLAESAIASRDGPLEPRVVLVDPARQYQVIEGFGASITDSAAWLIRRQLSPESRDALMRELFDPVAGLGFAAVRVPIGASDFSLSHYSFNDMPAGQADPKLRRFSIRAARKTVLPVARHARAINPTLRIFASPWSPPGWMKTSGSLIGGRLEPRFYDAYAHYLVRTIREFREAGVPVDTLTIQNEPHFEPANYPGMRMQPAERATFIGTYLGPLLARQEPATRLFDWDHNWDEPQSPLSVLSDSTARHFIAGIAWHCYAGDVAAQSYVHERYPDKLAWMTECSGGAWNPTWAGSLLWMMQHLIIGNLRNWGSGAILWNLALDNDSGPHLGGCGNCRGVVTIDRRSGSVTRNVEYYVLGHVSRFVKPGARRIDSRSEFAGLENVAFRNADDGSFVLIVLNTTSDAQRFSVRAGARAFTAELRANSVATYVWREAV